MDKNKRVKKKMLITYQQILKSNRIELNSFQGRGFPIPVTILKKFLFVI